MNLLLVIGIIGSVSSIISWFIPKSIRSKKLTMVAIILIIAAFSTVITYQHSKLNRIRRTEKAALELIAKSSMNFTSEGFVLGTLAFLEQNQDLYPDSYERANKIYTDAVSRNEYSWAGISSQMKGILTSISIISSID